MFDFNILCKILMNNHQKQYNYLKTMHNDLLKTMIQLQPSYLYCIHAKAIQNLA